MKYPPFYEKCLEAFEAAGRPVNRLLAPTDPVIAADPSLAKYASLFVSGANSCAESAYLLAERLVAQDAGDREHHRPLVLDLAGGISLREMRRRLQSSRMRHFPLLVYNRDLDSFVPASGDSHLRSDRWALVFIPADPIMLVAHWSFVQAVPNVNNAPIVSLDWWSVYTSVPLSRDAPPIFGGVHWRCEVTPENSAYFLKAKGEGWACDCAFWRRCPHETDFLQGAGGDFYRVVMVDNGREKGNYLAGAYIAHVDHAMFVEGWRFTAAPGNSMAITDPAGRITRLDGGRERSTMLVDGDHYAPDDVRLLQVGPLRLRAQRFSAIRICGFAFQRTFGDVCADVLDVNNWQHASYGYPAHAFGDFTGLGLVIPGAAQVTERLALREKPDRHSAMDTLRKVQAEHRHLPMDVTHEAILAWLERVSVEVGQALVEALAPGVCANCCLKAPGLYRGECKRCKQIRHAVPPEIRMVPDCVAVRIGVRGIWSIVPNLPEFRFKKGVEVRGTRGPLFKTAGQFRRWFADQHVDVSCRGRNCGPSFLGQVPICFPRAHPVAIAAFCVRLGAEPDVFAQGAQASEPDSAAWALMLLCARPEIEPLGPEPWEQFITHFSGEKKMKMLEAREAVNAGESPPLEEKGGEPYVRVRMTGFAKAEKGYDREVDIITHKLKPTQKPRFICSPNPLILARLGPYTHAQTKWLARRFHWRRGMFYAGCAVPEELNSWLNQAVLMFGEPWCVVDDITAIDASHSRHSFAFHRSLRRDQFAFEAWIEGAFNGEEHIMARIGPYVVRVDYVNASGVSDTSYKNSLICLFARMLALLHAALDLDTLSPEEVLHWMERLEREIRMSASGDDGLTYCCPLLLGTSLEDPSFLRRYREFWARLGFGVKVAIVPASRWRTATYLAMRPVWSGTRYVWAPEPARRLRGLFWQIDNSMHPIAWGRGVARQVLGMSGSVTVLRDLCEWYLRVTKGPANDVQVFGNPHSPWNQYASDAVPNDRADREFCEDYGVGMDCLRGFAGMLADVADVYVDINCHLVRAVFDAES